MKITGKAAMMGIKICACESVFAMVSSGGKRDIMYQQINGSTIHSTASGTSTYHRIFLRSNAVFFKNILIPFYIISLRMQR